MWKTMYRVNHYAYLSNRKMYICCLLLYLLSAMDSLVLFEYSEYNVNAAYYLIVGKTTLSDVLPHIICFLIAIAFFQVLEWLRSLAENRLVLSVSFHYEKELNKQLSDIRWDYFETHDAFLKIQESRTKSCGVLVKMLQKSMSFFGILPMILIYGYYLSRINLWVVVLFLASLFCFNRLGAKLKRDSTGLWQEIRPYAQRQEYYFDLCGDKVTHQEYQFNRLSTYVAEKWEEAYNSEIRFRMKIHKNVECRIKVAQLLFYLPRFLMLIYITIGILNGTYEVGFFIMANSMLANLSNNLTAVQEILEILRAEKSFLASFDEVMEFEKMEPNRKTVGDIVMQEVIYRYPQSDYRALDGLNLHLKKGEKIAIVGANGSGKTTAVNMILSLTKQENGQVETCGARQISTIFQDFAQYQATIKDNIVFGCAWKTFTDEEIWNLLAKVDLYEKVRSLPDGIHTKMGQLEKGVEFSKGQWQRLAIARLLANPEAEVWILDEPTAYLDPLSEIKIYELIYKLAGERTVLFISHRLGFARKADRIVVFQKGKIVENGSHEELIKKDSIYAEMFRLQEAWYVV